MNRSMKTVVLFLVVAVSELATAQSQREDISPIKNLAEIILPSLKFLSTTPVDCNVGPNKDDCPVITVKLYRGPVGGLDSCLAQLPSDINLFGRKPTLIVWQLDHKTISDPKIGDATYQFQTDNGIFVVSNGGNSLRGGIGDWGNYPNSDMYFHIFHSNFFPKRTAIYLPIILQTVTPQSGDPVVTLCGATDPKIVNN